MPTVLACLGLAGFSAQVTWAATGNIYFTAGEQFKPVERTVPDSGRRLPTVLGFLLAGPTKAERALGLGTAIPSGTKVLSESFDASTGTASIRFNSRFIYTRKIVQTRADAIKEYRGRAGEVVFTATSLPEVKAVRLSVPGKEPVTLRRSGFAEPAKPPKITKPAPPRGPKPTDIRGIQRALANLRYLPTSAVNGRYDDRTKQAILAFQSWNGLDRDGVGGPKTTASLRTAGIPKPGLKTAARRIEIYRRKGVMLLISGGRVQRAIHTSTGRGGDSPDLGTPPGSFKIYRRESNSWSVPYSVNLPYAAYWDRGWAIHGFKDVPAYAASAGCARVPLSEAPGVYEFARIGTLVRVY